MVVPDELTLQCLKQIKHFVIDIWTSISCLSVLPAHCSRELPGLPSL